VRQGKILSLALFNLFINIHCATKESRYGCIINRNFMGCILYADDIILLSASTGWPQKCKPLPNDQKIVLKPDNEIRFVIQIKV